MRYLKISNPSKIQTKEGPQEYHFHTFVLEFIFPDLRWRKEWADDYASVDGKLSAEAGTVAELTDQEHERLSQCASTVSVPPMILPSLMAHIHAITLASSVKAA